MQVTFCFKAPNTLYDNNKSQKITSDWKTNLEGKEKGRRIFDIKVDHYRENNIQKILTKVVHVNTTCMGNG